MNTAMTQLERELLGYVERLVASCEASATELRGLEQRSIQQHGEMVTGLKDCVALLMRSQLELITSFSGYLSEVESFEQLDERLARSTQLLRSAEAKLNTR